jgi:hypothetical protein
MSQVDPNLDDLQNDDPRGLRDYAERQQREAAEARQELADLRKKDGFRDAGLDPTNPLHAAVISGYTGDSAGIKDFVTGLGLTSSNQAPPEPPIPPEEQAALDRVAGMPSGDGGAPVNPDADGNARLKAISDQAVAEKWATNKFNEVFTAEMIRQRRPVGNMDVSG